MSIATQNAAEQAAGANAAATLAALKAAERSAPTINTIQTPMELAAKKTNPYPTAPASGDWSPLATQVLGQTYLNAEGGLGGNDIAVFNDCVIAAMAKYFGMCEANAGRTPLVYENTKILRAYENYCNGGTAITPGDYGPGCILSSCLERWGNSSLINVDDTLVGVVQLPTNNPAALRAGLWLFGGLILDAEIPVAWETAWQNNPGPGWVWDVASPPDLTTFNHCVLGTGWQSGSLNVNSWGTQGEITDAAIGEYAVQAYVVLLKQWINPATSKSPSGFTLRQLRNYITAFGGQLFN